jgi:hypothetical protein
MNAADKLDSLEIDLATWDEQAEGYRRAVLSPDLWPALVGLVRAAEALGVSDHPGERDALRAALAALDEALA